MLTCFRYSFTFSLAASRQIFQQPPRRNGPAEAPAAAEALQEAAIESLSAADDEARLQALETRLGHLDNLIAQASRTPSLQSRLKLERDHVVQERSILMGLNRAFTTSTEAFLKINFQQKPKELKQPTEAFIASVEAMFSAYAQSVEAYDYLRRRFRSHRVHTLTDQLKTVHTLLAKNPAASPNLLMRVSALESRPFAPIAQFKTDRLYLQFIQKKPTKEYEHLVDHGRRVEQLAYKGRQRMIERHEIVFIDPQKEYFDFKAVEELPLAERYMRPYALRTLRQLAKTFHEFTGGYKLVLASVFRTPNEQSELQNAAKTDGTSTHSFANTFDVSNGRFITPQGTMVTWSDLHDKKDSSPQARKNFETIDGFKIIIEDLLLAHQRQGTLMGFKEAAGWHVMVTDPTIGNGSMFERGFDESAAQAQLARLERSMDAYEVQTDTATASKRQNGWVPKMNQLYDSLDALEHLKIPSNRPGLIGRKITLVERIEMEVSRLEDHYQDSVDQLEKDLLERVTTPTSTEPQTPERVDRLERQSVDKIFTQIQQKYPNVPAWQFMRMNRYATDPLVCAYMESATYHDFLRHGFILNGSNGLNGSIDETEKYSYLNLNKLWARKIAISHGSNRRSMELAWDNIQQVPTERFTFNEYRTLVAQVWKDMLPRLKKAGLTNRYTEAISSDLIFAISIHELAPTHMVEAKGYNALGRVHTIRTLLDNGLQPSRIPAIHDRAASFGAAQTICSTHNTLRSRYNPYMDSKAQIPVFEQCNKLRNQLEIAIWFAFENLAAVQRYFSGSFFEGLYKNSTPNQRMRFFASVIAAMHNGGNSRGMREAMRKTFHGTTKGKSPDRADYWVDSNPKTKDTCRTLEDARIAYLNIVEINKHSTAMRHGIQAVQIYEILNEREGRTTTPTAPDRTAQAGSSEVLDTDRRLSKRTYNGRSYFVFSIPDWKLSRLGKAILTQSTDAVMDDIRRFNNFQKGQRNGDQMRFEVNDVIWIPLEHIKWKSGDFVTIRVKNAADARAKMDRLCVGGHAACEDAIMMYSNDKEYARFDQVEGKIRVPKELLVKGWEKQVR